jgi:hypothetical protein
MVIVSVVPHFARNGVGAEKELGTQFRVFVRVGELKRGLLPELC